MEEREKERREEELEVWVESVNPFIFYGGGEFFVRGVTPDKLRKFLEKKFGKIEAKKSYKVKLKEVLG